MPTTQQTSYEVRDAGAWIRFDRPERRNALSPTLIAETYEHLLAANEDDDVRCIVLTGAPPAFVHTFFSEDTGGELPEGTRALVFGSIRSGRTDDQKRRLVDEMTGSVAETLGIPSGEISVTTVDMPASWVMEGGDVLPEPGEEAAWLERHG